MALAVYSHAPGDFAVLQGGCDGPPQNWIGEIGAYLSCTAFYFFGLSTYILLGILILGVVRIFLPRMNRRHGYWIGVGVLLIGSMLLLGLSAAEFSETTDRLGIGRSLAPESALAGGVIGQLLAAPSVGDVPPGWLRHLIGPVGCAVVGWALILLGAVLIYLSDWRDVATLVLAHRDREADGLPPAQKLKERLTLFRNVPAALQVLCRQPDAQDGNPTGATVMPDNTKDSAPSAVEMQRMTLPGAETASPGATDQRIEEGTVQAVLPDALQTVPEVQPAVQNVNPAVAAPEIAVERPEEIPRAEQAVVPEMSEKKGNPFERKMLVATAPEFSVENSKSASSDDAVSVHEAPIPDVEPVEKGKKLSAPVSREYILPSVPLLSKGAESSGESAEMLELARGKLQRTLDSFKVPAHVVGEISGPRITRFEIALDDGVKVDRVTRLENNIAMDMEARHIRILAPIPGRPLMGVEVPNRESRAVFMSSIMETDAWRNTRAEIPIVLGKDVAGTPMVMDLAKAPHLLIAGTTGSGKSVCMNTLIMSLLFRFSPDELQLIMVDPKVVEMDAYQTLPHLITPVINASEKVPVALRWAVGEMERRYRVLAAAHVKNLKGFNSRPKSETIQLDPDGNPIPDKMPILVIILDELADLMMTPARKDVETSISKITQKGRAAGIHMVIATQRPSRDIITGVIKANLPSRIAFQVGSNMDSRVILDHPGAEKLLGRGDMLFSSPSSGELERIQGAMMPDDDIFNVVKFISVQRPQRFDDQVLAEEDPDAENLDDFNADEEEEDLGNGEMDYRALVRKYSQKDDDKIVRQALEVIILDRKASISYLQRRMKIGYNTAANLIELFESRGIIGPEKAGGGKRDILIYDDIVREQS